MPPRRPSALGFRGIRPRLNDTFYAKLRAGGFRLTLGTYKSLEEAARVYDTAAWHVGRPRREMNFPEKEPLVEAEFLAPTPALITEEDHRRHRALQRRLAIAEHDENAMAEWRRQFPRDVHAEVNFYAARRAERRAAARGPPPAQGVHQCAIKGPHTIPAGRGSAVGRHVVGVRRHHLRRRGVVLVFVARRCHA
uniref:Uncharacterized protein n=1 Tax=Avena sativa TaxID=4498 RepID=A0ACD5UDW8_AVESA